MSMKIKILVVVNILRKEIILAQINILIKALLAAWNYTFTIIAYVVQVIFSSKSHPTGEAATAPPSLISGSDNNLNKYHPNATTIMKSKAYHGSASLSFSFPRHIL